jgi:DNA-3-methyladenine glycosylase II
LVAAFPNEAFPSPKALIAASDETLRGAGLSRQKSAALRDIAQKRLDGIIPTADDIQHLSDEDVVARLTQARGVGRWTEQMHLIFSMGRQDILPIDDLGVRKGAEKLFARPFTPKELAAFGERWSPWRSAAAWHLWRMLDMVAP